MFNLVKSSMRKTKVVGFSIPPELYKKFESTLKTTYKTKSELFRHMLNSYLELSETIGENKDTNAPNIDESDLAKILKLYWNMRSASNKQIILLCLGIIEYDGKILIGARRGKDKWIDNLTWVFPGGRIESLDFESEMRREIYEETGLNVSIENLISSRIHPDSGQKPVQIVTFYFHCKSNTADFIDKESSNLSKLKWIKPSDVFKYFTGSTSDEVTRFLFTIDQAL